MRTSIARLISSHSHRAGKASYSTATTAVSDQWNAVVEWRDGDRQRQPRPGPLSGWRTTVKMNICTAQLNTTCSSRMLQGWNAGYDATAVEHLQSAGADIVGKTNCDEFGMGSGNIHSVYGPAINPASPPEDPRVTGGSSGGAAASVRAGLCRIALASDTGGSIRLPASYCGVYGFKPSYGLVSRLGLVSYADSLDTVGLLSSTVSDVVSAFDVINSFDRRDPSTASEETRQVAHKSETAAISQLDSMSGIKGLRVGIPKQYFPREVSAAVRSATLKAADLLRRKGATIHYVDLPLTSRALSAYYILASAEASSNLARYDGSYYGFRASPIDEDGHRLSDKDRRERTRDLGFGEEVKKRILLGTYALTSELYDNYFLKAQDLRAKITADFNSVLSLPDVRPTSGGSAATAGGGVDVLLNPAAVSTAPRIADLQSPRDGGVSEYVQDVLTTPVSLAGLPSLCVPFGTSPQDNMPIGVALTTQWGHDRLLWPVAVALEGH